MARQALRDHLRAVAPFDRLGEEALGVFESAGEWAALPAGEQLFAFGDKGDAMYVVVEGKLQVLIPGTQGESIVVAEVGAPSILGEIQILMGGKRTASVRAATPCRLIKLGRAAFDRLSATAPDALAEFNGMMLQRLRRNQLVRLLTRYFGALPPAQLEEIEAMGERRRLAQGEVLFRQGDRLERLAIVINGSLGVRVRNPEGGETIVARVRLGELAGEAALLNDQPAVATVYAIRETELVQFSIQQFQPLLERHPKFLLHLARTAAARSIESSAAGDGSTDTIFVSLVSAAGAPLAEVARLLAAELRRYCPVLHLNSANVADLLEMPGVAQAPRISPQATSFLAWLSAQEGAYRFILFEADTTETNWTQRCVSQSDQVITVGRADGDPALTAVETALYRSDPYGGVPKRLVLIHPDGEARASGTAAWLGPRQVVMHHHVRLASREDFQRLARFVSGSAVCLALGGGGARGFAHIGAMRAFREAGIPIDIVGGTSMGAVIGAEQAMGVPVEGMVDLNRNLFSNFGLLLDMTLPLISFTTGRAYARTLRRTFGDVAIEDLWVPFFCISSNISRAVMAVHRAGQLRKYLRASSGVQGLFPPIVMQGELHVDGALFSNLPADVMKSVCAGQVIAVDVTPPVDLAENPDYGETLSGWRLLWQRLFSRGKRLPSVDLGTVMQRSAEAASMARQKRVIERMTDYYVLMPVAQFNLMNFGAIDRLCEIGYVTTKQAIAEWRANGRLAALLPPD